ncbi:hypothetical protein M1494_00275 [Candidatus Parvarchaeota archaeon]|nr:hypothetical protein [Candidatus Parvarchaeota archaeon]
MQIKGSKKGQGAVEALMTYGWMIILVAAVIIVLFLLGVFSPLYFVSPSPTISGFTGIKVTAVVANYTYVEFYLTNDLSIAVNLNKFSLTYNSTSLSDIKCEYLTLSPGQNSICFAKLNLANMRDTVSLGIGFAVSSDVNASSNGTMSFVPADISIHIPSIITEFSEEGLTSGLQWWVDYDGINHSSTGTEVSFATSPGNYSFIVGNTVSNGCTFTASPSSGYVEAGLVQNIIFLNSCAATFIEKELPSGTKWQVTYANVPSSSTSNLIVFTNEKSGSYPFSVSNVIVGGCNYLPSPSSGSLSVGDYQYIRFLGECTTTFAESGLPSGYKWNMTYEGIGNSSTNSVITYFGSPGNYSYSISTLSNSTSTPDCGTTYTPSPSSGKVAAGSTLSIIFSAETTCTTTFTENGLPSGYQWTVTYDFIPKDANAPSNVVFVIKTSGGSIPTYTYSVPTLTNSSSTLACTTTYSPSPSSGSAEEGTTISISFTDYTACITTFTETRLSSGTTWSVTYNGNPNSSTAPSDITFKTNVSGASIPAYPYTVTPISPNSSSVYDCTTATTPSPSSGTDLSAGSTIAISFSYATTCITTFTEAGLPPGYKWNVTFNAVNEDNSSPDNIVFKTVTSGAGIPSYSYSVPTLTNSSSTLDCTTTYTPSPSSNTVSAGSTNAISFSGNTDCITTFDESNLPTSYPWNVTFNNVEKTSTLTSMQFTTLTSSGSIPSYSYSVPTLSATSVEWNFGTSSYQGDIYQGMPTEAFPSSLSDLNNNVVACSSPYDSQGYTAVAYMYFTSSITVTITTDDATAVFYTPAGSNSWTSVFGSNAWKGEPATQYGPTTISVTPGWYEVAVDWTNQCGQGMSAFEINGAYMLSSQFNVIGWTPSSNSVQLLSYSDVTANPADPSGITVEQTGSWSHEFNGYFTFTYAPSPSSNTVSAGSTNDISYSTSGSSTTVFYETGLPSGYTWSVSYDNGAASGSASTGSPINLSLSSQSSQSSYTATASVSGLACTSSVSVEEGTTYTFTSWTCTTTFDETGLPSGTSWIVTYLGNQYSSTSTSLQATFTTSTVSTTAQSFTVSNSGLYYPYPSQGSAVEGTTASPTIQFTDTQCTTIDFTTTSNNQHYNYYCVGGSETQIFWNAGKPGYIYLTVVGANGQTYASGSTTNWPDGGIQGTYALPLQAYNVYGGTGNGGGSGTAQVHLYWPLSMGGGTGGTSDGQSSLTVSTSSGYNEYLCAAGSGYGSLSVSNCNTQNSNSGGGSGDDSIVGTGTSDSITASGLGDFAAAIAGFDPATSPSVTTCKGSCSYTVSSDYSQVFIVAATGWFDWTSFSVPSGYYSSVSYQGGDDYEDAAIYAYMEQNAGTYSISLSNNGGYPAIYVLVFPPVAAP